MAETFLEALTPEEVTDLRVSGRERHYDANVALFHEGDDAGSVIVLLAGRAKLTVPSSSGREVIVAVRGPGDLLGELAALVEAPRSATVTTIEAVDALIMAGSAFASFLERNARVALVILRLVAERSALRRPAAGPVRDARRGRPRGPPARRAHRALRRRE